MLRALRSRPLAVTALVYLFSLFLFLFLSHVPLVPMLSVLSILSVFAVLCCLPTLKRRLYRFLPYRILLILTVVALLLSTLTAYSVNREREKTKTAFQETEMLASFTVERIAHYDGAVSAWGILTPDQSEEAYPTRITFFDETVFEMAGGGYAELSRGDTLVGVFSLSAVKGNTLSELWQYADGYDLEGNYVEGGICTARGYRSLVTVTEGLREKLSELFFRTLGENGYAMTSALLLADKSGIDYKVKQGFSTLGISHLLAVSGLHLAIVIGMLERRLRATRLPCAAIYPLLIAVTFTYIVLTGFSPSMLRAGGMLILFYLSYFVSRSRDSLTSLAAAGLVIVLISPRAVLDLALLFSFLATLGIILIATPLSERIKRAAFFEASPNALVTFGKRLCQTILTVSVMTLGATLTVLPVLWLASGEFFLLAPISNLIFAPFFTLLLYLMPLYLVTLPIPFVKEAVAFLIEFLSGTVFTLSDYGRSLSPFSLSLSYSFVPYLFLTLILVALILCCFRKRYLALLSLSFVFLLLPIGVAIDNTALTEREAVSYLSDGKNDLVFVSYEERRMLIVFSASGNFVKDSYNPQTLDSPTVKTDTLFFTELRQNHVALISDLAETGFLTDIIIPEGEAATDEIEAHATGLGIAVTRYTPNDTVVYHGIPVRTYAALEKTLAVEITLQKRSLLYLRENAPNEFDIRFGVMKSHHDTVILGCYGNKIKGSLKLCADTIGMWERNNKITLQEGQTILLGNRTFTDYRLIPSETDPSDK